MTLDTTHANKIVSIKINIETNMAEKYFYPYEEKKKTIIQIPMARVCINRNVAHEFSSQWMHPRARY